MKEVILRTGNRTQTTISVLTGLLLLGMLFIPLDALAGPYLLTSNEMSIARSTKECGVHAEKALRTLQRKRQLKMDQKNKLLGWTNDSTMGVQCIFVGQNAHKRSQWIFQISIASTNWEESKKLLKLMRNEFSRMEWID